VQPTEITEILNRPTSQELLARDLTRLAYIAKDGTPRSIPIAFTWNGTEIVMCTTKNAPKLPALRHNPAVALNGLFDPEYAEVFGVPFAFIPASGPTKDPKPRRAPVRVGAIPERAARITFRHLIGYRLELPDPDLTAHFPAAHARLSITTDIVPTRVQVDDITGSLPN
jgi:hypothetical protein